MISLLRQWIARWVAAVVTVLTLGLVTVEWKGVGPLMGGVDEGDAITAVEPSNGAPYRAHGS